MNQFCAGANNNDDFSNFRTLFEHRTALNRPSLRDSQQSSHTPRTAAYQVLFVISFVFHKE